jgi:hypothetical protein
MNRLSSSYPVIIGILLTILVASSATTTLLSNHIVYAHTFSENENALFLTLVKLIEAQALLAQNNFPSNPNLAQQNANNAISLLYQNDPVVNLTWASQISERNSRVAAQLAAALNSLKNATTTSTADVSSANDIKTNVDRINGLLAEAMSSRVPKETLTNATTRALVLANLANEVYFSYGRALGQSQSAMTSMAGMAMSVNEASSSPSMNTSSINMNNTGNNTGISPSVAMSSGSSGSNNNAIKNMTEYQTAQALAGIAKEVFNKDLKPIAPSTLKDANMEIENDLNQLKVAVDNKVPFTNILKIVHIQLHPTLITAYHLQLEHFH